MHIGIDAHAIGARQGGNETYISNLIKSLSSIDSENQYTIYLANRDAANHWRRLCSEQYPNFKVRKLPPPTPLVKVPMALEIELRLRPVDLLHVQYTAPLFCPVPVVVTIHDLAFEHMPETFTRRGSFQMRLTVRRTAGKARRIATVSEFSRQDLIKTYKLDPAKVVVTRNGVDGRFSPVPDSQSEFELIGERYGIGREYILAVGSLHPRKNIVRLIRAYAGLRNRHPDFKHQLVIVGRKLWLANEIFDEVKRQKWSEDVILTGYVSDDDLPKLYREATVFVYPSIFEGFGLPPLEAMACGTPVITGNTSSLPEVVGDAAVMIDPYDERELAESLLRVLGDGRLRERLREKGIERAGQFTWRSAAEKTLQLYKDSLK